MSEPEITAEALTGLKPDRFADLLPATDAHGREHGCDLGSAPVLPAREIGVLVRATRASYVLEVGTGLGYCGLHAVDGFGRTGRLDTIERDQVHAQLAEENFRRYGLADRVRVHCGREADVLAGLNGPYDMLVLHAGPAGDERSFEDILRLLRTGGTLLVNSSGGGPALDSFLRRLATDDRLLPSFGPGMHHVVAVRIR